MRKPLVVATGLLILGFVMGGHQVGAQGRISFGPAPSFANNLNMMTLNTTPGLLRGFTGASASSSLSTFDASIIPFSTSAAYGSLSFSQASPAVPAVRATSTGAPATSFGSAGPSGFFGPALPPPTAPSGGGANYSLVSTRPNFAYNQSKLNFSPTPPSATSPTTGQTNMGVGAGRPAGSIRYVPVGQF